MKGGQLCGSLKAKPRKMSEQGIRLVALADSLRDPVLIGIEKSMKILCPVRAREALFR